MRHKRRRLVIELQDNLVRWRHRLLHVMTFREQEENPLCHCFMTGATAGDVLSTTKFGEQTPICSSPSLSARWLELCRVRQSLSIEHATVSAWRVMVRELWGRVSQGLRRSRDSGSHIGDSQKVNIIRPFWWLFDQEEGELRMLGRLSVSIHARQRNIYVRALLPMVVVYKKRAGSIVEHSGGGY